MPSVMQRVGTPNAQHNLDNQYRKQLDHVDPSLSQYNEVIRHRTVEDIYAEHLQPSFVKFNEQQKRKDRRLDVKWECTDALGYQRALDRAAQASNNKIGKKGRPPIRELVWQIGNPEQGYGCKDQTPESREKIKTMLLECQAEAERRYPQFVWGDVVFHADEVSKDAADQEHGSIHLHSDFVSLCYDNKRGPDVQVAFERCLKEMGFETFEAWKHDLDNIMETVLERHGLERTVMNNTNEHQNSTEFHRQQKVIAQTRDLEKELQEVNEEVAVRQAMIGGYEEKIGELQDIHHEVDNSLFEKRQELQKTSQELQTATEGLETVKEEVSGLAAEKTALTAVVESLREVQADVAACEIERTPVPFKAGKSIVDNADLDRLQLQAKAYVADSEREQRLDAREKVVADREYAVGRKEHDVIIKEIRSDQRADRIDAREKEVNETYEQNRAIYKSNQTVRAELADAKLEIGRLTEENAALKAENGSLKAELVKVKQSFVEQFEALKERFRGAYESLTAVVKAVSMLKYDKVDGYKVEGLTKKQGRLIDAIAEYGARWAKADGFPDKAEDMIKHIGISDELKKDIAALEKADKKKDGPVL